MCKMPAPMLDDDGDLLDRGVVRVAEVAGAVIGLIVMSAEPDHFYVDNIAVDLRTIIRPAVQQFARGAAGLWHPGPVHPSDIERITAFDSRFAKAQATDVVDLPWGFAVLQEEFPLSWYHNRIAVTSAASAAEVLAAAEEVLGGAALRHRYVSVDGAQGQALRADFVAAGYEHETIVTMIHSGVDAGPATHEVRAVSLDTLRPAIIRDWRITLPDATDEHLGQLADRTALAARGVDVTLLAVYDGDEIAARAELYIDRTDRIAQFENLVTHTDFRCRGYGDSLVRDALRRGREAGSELRSLTAGLDDWPHEWYQRRGYVDAGRTHHFSRHD